MGEFPSFAETKSRTLVPLFLSFLRDDYYGAVRRNDPDAKDLDLDRRPASREGEEELQEVHDMLNAPPSSSNLGNIITNGRLLNFLHLFQKVRVFFLLPGPACSVGYVSALLWFECTHRVF